MKKLILLFLLITQIGFGQTITQSFKTIVDYGAVMYTDSIVAMKDKQSSHLAIQSMLEEHGAAILPPYGWFYIDDTVIMLGLRDNVTSLGRSNKGVNLITDKPISMFLITNNEQEVNGFTAWYKGKDITKECAVVHIGGDARNIGGEYINNKGEAINFRPRRTNAVGVNVDVDLVNDDRYALYQKHGIVNENYIKSYGANAVWINFDEKDEDIHSRVHFSSFKGFWKYANTGFKLKTKYGAPQSINTILVDAQIWGANKFADIDRVDFSKVKIIGQELGVISPNENVSLFDISGSTLSADVFVYDVAGKRYGNYNIKGKLNIIDRSALSLYWRDTKPFIRMPNTKFNDSNIINK